MQSAPELPRRRHRALRPASDGGAASTVRDAPSLEALQLLGRWRRVCNGHLVFTMGCACGFGGAIDLSDCDDMILDYLLTRFSDTPRLTACIIAHAGLSPARSGSLQALLRALATGRADLEPGQAHGLLQAIEGSIASIEEQHAL